MPFINGRYHMNPTMGQALEAAREAEAALLALQQHASTHADASTDAATNSEDDAAKPSGSDAPIHHIEIDAAETVPAATGRVTRGFVARVHRASAAPAGSAPASSPASSAETHVFADHRDLLNFLRDSLAQK